MKGCCDASNVGGILPRLEFAILPHRQCNVEQRRFCYLVYIYRRTLKEQNTNYEIYGYYN